MKKEYKVLFVNNRENSFYLIFVKFVKFFFKQKIYLESSKIFIWNHLKYL